MGDKLQADAMKIRLNAYKLADNVMRRWRAQLSHEIMRARPIDLHGLSIILGELTLADPEFSDSVGDLIPQAEDHAEATERFPSFFGDLNAEDRTKPFSGSQQNWRPSGYQMPHSLLTTLLSPAW